MAVFVSTQLKDLKQSNDFPEKDEFVFKNKLNNIETSAKVDLESKLDHLSMSNSLVAAPCTSFSSSKTPDVEDLPVADVFSVDDGIIATANCSIGLLDDQEVSFIRIEAMNMLSEHLQAAFNLLTLENKNLCSEQKAEEDAIIAEEKLEAERKKAKEAERIAKKEAAEEIAKEVQRLNDQRKRERLELEEEQKRRRERQAAEDRERAAAEERRRQRIACEDRARAQAQANDGCCSVCHVYKGFRGSVVCDDCLPRKSFQTAKQEHLRRGRCGSGCWCTNACNSGCNAGAGQWCRHIGSSGGFVITEY